MIRFIFINIIDMESKDIPDNDDEVDSSLFKTECAPDQEPELSVYRKVILIAYSLSLLVIGALASYYNATGPIIVEVFYA